mmetsp:Transcript_8135/g.23347  ORF Transcript_8135/g.23347 Transcript_8135/m.23347 type:complete len:126 (-) Transcript_8135:1114-1491(-)
MSGQVATRSHALRLYRNIIRAARSWQGPKEEVDYIHSERRALFEANKVLTDIDEVVAKIEEGESRLQIAVHYGIPYPRLHHAAPNVYKPVPVVDQEELQYSPNPALNAKLKAAMERRLKQNDSDE